MLRPKNSSEGEDSVKGKLQGRVAIVYGAGSVGEGWGNGKASAVAYARAGAKVACIDMNEAAAQATASIINGEGGDAIAVKANVTDLDQVRAATDAVVKAFGGTRRAPQQRRHHGGGRASRSLRGILGPGDEREREEHVLHL